MASYDDLSSLTGKLKRAAIDAYMKDQGFTIESESKYYDERHSVSDLHYWVSRPGSDGNGGGDWTSDHFLPDSWIGGGGKDREFTNNFNTIRGRVDDALKKWQDLPKPGEFDGIIESMRLANVALAASPATSGGSTNGSGQIGANLNLIQENSDAMSGGIISAFKSKFLLSLGNCVGGHHGLTIVLGGALAGEKLMWEKARQDVANAVENAGNALDAYAKKGGGEWKFEIALVAAVLGGIGAFVTGGASGIIAGAGAGLTLLKEGGEAAERTKASHPPGQNFEGLMKGFENNLNEINKAIRIEEETVERNLATNIQRVGPDAGFDLEAPLQNVDDDSDLHLAGNPTIIHNKSLVFEITGTAMPGIAGEVAKARGYLDDASESGPFSRDAAVGLGYNGFFNKWSSLLWLSWRLLDDLDWEIRNGAKTLELAVRDMGDRDAEASAALEAHAKVVAEGSGQTPYDGI